MLEYNLTFFEKFLLKLVHQNFQRVRIQALKVDDFENLTFQPLFVFILILNQAIIKLFLDIWEYVQQFHEIVLTDHANRAVIFGLNGGRSF